MLGRFVEGLRVVERTTKSRVVFRREFQLGLDTFRYPAAAYEVEIDEVGIEGNDRTVWVRKATLLHLRNGNESVTRTIDPTEFEAAVARDAAD